MTLTRGEITALAVAFGAVVLSAIIHIAIREWYQPDLRYETGGYYIFEDSAVTSLRITNHGHSDAEAAVVVVNFAYPIRDVSIDSKAVVFKITSGEIGDTAMTVGIERLVPEQSVSIFFAINSKGVPSHSLPKDFLTSLTFKGGSGKTGLPIWAPTTAAFATLLFYIPLTWGMFAYFRSKQKPHYKRISEMIDLAIDAHNSNLSREEVLSHAETLTVKESYRKRTLREIAVRVFDAIDKKHIAGDIQEV